MSRAGARSDTVEGAHTVAAACGGQLPGSNRWGPASEVWGSDSWRWEATRWMDAVLEKRGVTRVPTSPRQPRIRPWSTQLVVETDQGRVWFKAGVPEQSCEVAILHILRKVAPDAVTPVWAGDRERCWSLQPDQGTALREVADAESIVSAWSSVLRAYARLQRASASVIDELVAAGVPEFGPHDLLAGWRARGWPGERVVDGRLAEAADRLAEVGLPATIQHDDLHAGNVFSAGVDSASLHDARVFDWGDAYIGNPLCSLLVALRNPAYHFGLADDDERDQRLIRAYLSGWSDVATSSTLARVLPDALLLARVGRVLGWERALARATEAERAHWQPHIDQWVGEILDLAAD